MLGDAMRYSLIVIAVILFPAVPGRAQIDADQLKKQIAEYSSCQAGCAESFASDLATASPDIAIKVVGYLKSLPKASKTFQLLAFVALAQDIYATGKKIGKDNAACYHSCDKLNLAIVELGKSGALGPVKRGEKIDPAIFDNPKVLDAYSKFVKPITLPAEERSKDWVKFIASLS